ncbi:ATP-binding cassette domain-containing protein [candidate division KSB1 bacterium]|nr:ATP-binding cassette domain-containing protein [candidate division KSB1 bacterium]
MATLELMGVSKFFGDITAVDDFSLSVPGGVIYGFLGPNGAGKTTTLRMIMNIITPDQGKIEMFGHPRHFEDLNRVGYLPEEKGLYKKMKVRDFVAYLGSLHDLPKAQAQREAMRYLDELGLGEWKDRKCETLSKGMQQKAQFIGTILHDPDLIILDEPFSGLDPVNAELLKDIILKLKARNKTIIFSTHIMEQAEKICDDIVLINKGRKILDGALDQVKAEHKTRTINVTYEGDGKNLLNLPMVDAPHSRDYGNYAEIVLKTAADPQLFLKAALDQIRILQFDIRQPSLQEIFISQVGREVPHA